MAQVLKDALISANSIPVDIWNGELEARKAVDERLAEGKVKLEEAVSKSPALEGLKKGSVAIIAGLASAGVTCLLNPASILMVMVLAAGAGATVSAIAEAIKSSEGSSKVRFGALAHYVAVLR